MLLMDAGNAVIFGLFNCRGNNQISFFNICSGAGVLCSYIVCRYCTMFLKSPIGLSRLSIDVGLSCIQWRASNCQGRPQLGVVLSSCSSVQSAKFIPKQILQNKQTLSFLSCVRFTSAIPLNFFYTFHARFIKTINVDKITNAFVKKLRKQCKRLLHLRNTLALTLLTPTVAIWVQR